MSQARSPMAPDSIQSMAGMDAWQTNTHTYKGLEPAISCTSAIPCTGRTRLEEEARRRLRLHFLLPSGRRASARGSNSGKLADGKETIHPTSPPPHQSGLTSFEQICRGCFFDLSLPVLCLCLSEWNGHAYRCILSLLTVSAHTPPQNVSRNTPVRYCCGFCVFFLVSHFRAPCAGFIFAWFGTSGNDLPRAHWDRIAEGEGTVAQAENM